MWPKRLELVPLLLWWLEPEMQQLAFLGGPGPQPDPSRTESRFLCLEVGSWLFQKTYHNLTTQCHDGIAHEHGFRPGFDLRELVVSSGQVGSSSDLARFVTCPRAVLREVGSVA